MEFYSYLWLREDGSPYYVGKRSGIRAFRNQHGVHRPKDKTRILLFPQDNEADAFQSEKDLIALFGRRDNGTGILRNLTDGGEGVSGFRHTESSKQQISLTLMGHSPTPGMTGRHHSEETKQKMRLSSQGQIPWSKGRTLSQEHRRKLSIAAVVREKKKREKRKCQTLTLSPT